jgi:hypothetical protein
MAYGQYSAGSCRRTKADLVAHFGAEHDIETAKLGGHNRLDFTTRSGARVFTLHLTAVATLSPDGTRLTLADGGWPTPTTRTAWSDALSAFRIGWSWQDMPSKTERSVTYIIEGGRIAGRAEATPDLPMIRASVDHGEGGNFAVRFDAKAKRIVSDAGVTIPCTPYKALVSLYRVDKLARATSRFHAFRGQALDQFGFVAFGYHITPGQSSSIIMIGCHSFKTREIRAVLADLAAKFPEQAKKARKVVKADPSDFGVAAYEARRAAYVAELQARRVA